MAQRFTSVDESIASQPADVQPILQESAPKPMQQCQTPAR